MATIKLQPSGNVLIKDGKVSCGCCGVCGCAQVSGTLKSAIESATQISINGISPNQTVSIVAAWNGIIFEYFGEDHPPPEEYANIIISYSEGILCVVYEDEQTDSVFLLPESLSPEDCHDGSFPSGITTINVNGNNLRASFVFADNIVLTVIFS